MKKRIGRIIGWIAACILIGAVWLGVLSIIIPGVLAMLFTGFWGEAIPVQAPQNGVKRAQETLTFSDELLIINNLPTLRSEENAYAAIILLFVRNTTERDRNFCYSRRGTQIFDPAAGKRVASVERFYYTEFTALYPATMYATKRHFECVRISSQAEDVVYLYFSLNNEESAAAIAGKNYELRFRTDHLDDYYSLRMKRTLDCRSFGTDIGRCRSAHL